MKNRVIRVAMCLGVLGAGVLAGGLSAQAVPVFTADMISPRRATPVEPPAVKLESADVAKVFERACIQPRGDAAVAADWALSQGYESLDAIRGSTEPLLEGRPGAVLAMPGTEGAVFLVLTDAQCTLWAEGQSGPLVRRAFAAMLGQLATKGAKAQLLNERNIERGGAWRSQSQWRFRGVGASADLSLGLVTTLIELPSTQVMRLQPLSTEAKHTPDGVPLR